MKFNSTIVLLDYCVSENDCILINYYYLLMYTFSDVMETYQKMMNSLAYQLLLLMLKWLEVSEDELNWKLSMSQDALQLNSFPACPDPKSTIGLAPHTDSMLMTVLHQSHEGLQIFRDGIGWVTVSPIEGALVVNLGNLMDILSNGKFPSIQHRVFVNQIRHRISVAYFCFPPTDSQVHHLLSLNVPFIVL